MKGMKKLNKLILRIIEIQGKITRTGESRRRLGVLRKSKDRSKAACSVRTLTYHPQFHTILFSLPPGFVKRIRRFLSAIYSSPY
jgi:hypothetical protein